MIIEIDRLAQVLLFKKFMLQRYVLHEKYRQKRFMIKDPTGALTREKMHVYLTIEHEVHFLMQTKLKENDTLDYETERATLSLAIERVAGNKLTKIEDDLEFEKKLFFLRKIYQRWYYNVAYGYKLPTLRILPFILRLIRS